MTLKVSTTISVSAIVFLTFAVVRGIDLAWVGEMLMGWRADRFTWLVTVVSIWGAVEVLAIFLITFGLVLRKILLSHTPLVVIAVAVAVVVGPDLTVFDIAAGTLWIGAVALLWSPAITKYFDALRAIRGAIADATNLRISSTKPQ